MVETPQCGGGSGGIYFTIVKAHNCYHQFLKSKLLSTMNLKKKQNYFWKDRNRNSEWGEEGKKGERKNGVEMDKGAYHLSSYHTALKTQGQGGHSYGAGHRIRSSGTANNYYSISCLILEFLINKRRNFFMENIKVSV